jgi:hypothetical protein
MKEVRMYKATNQSTNHSNKSKNIFIKERERETMSSTRFTELIGQWPPALVKDDLELVPLGPLRVTQRPGQISITLRVIAYWPQTVASSQFPGAVSYSESQQLWKIFRLRMMTEKHQQCSLDAVVCHRNVGAHWLIWPHLFLSFTVWHAPCDQGKVKAAEMRWQTGFISWRN